MKKFLLIIVGLLLLSPTTCANQQFTNPPPLRWRRELITTLSVVSANSPTEIMGCVIGQRTSAAYNANRLLLSDMTYADTISVYGGNCPDSTLAFWHNHPYTYHQYNDGDMPRDECALSHEDIQTSLHWKFPYSVVTVGLLPFDRDTAHDRFLICWWSIDQIRKFANAPYLLSISNQRFRE